jgi:hypothetical protein
MGQERSDETRQGHTRFVQWNVLCRAAVILGIIDSYNKENNLKIAELLKKQVADGRVIKKKGGTAQSSAAWYAAKLP